MRSRSPVAVAVGVAMVLAASSAMAQRRDSGAASGVFKIRLEVPVTFGEVTVPAHRYRLTLSGDGFALADVDTMVLVATVPVERTTVDETVSGAKAEVTRHGNAVTIELRYGDALVKATGTVSAGDGRSDESLVTLAAKKERLIDDAGPSQASDATLVRKALNRYLRSVKHCADAAHRGRWRTDDPRFVRCVCPIVAKWRLPKVEKRLRVHQPLSKGRSGFSFSVTAEGKTDACRVWVGASPPPEGDAHDAPPVSTEAPEKVPADGGTPDASPSPATTP